MDQFNIHCN